MSPLWSDMALARAAWDDAADRGLVERSEKRSTEDKRDSWVDRIRRNTPRRPIRRQLKSYAL